MDEHKNIQLMKQAYAAFQKGDIPTILNMLSSDFEWICPGPKETPFAGTYHGRERMGQFFKGVGESVEILQFEPRQYIAQNDSVVVLGFERSKVKSTGRTFENHWAHVFTIRDGKVTRGREYSDTAAVAGAFQESKVYA